MTTSTINHDALVAAYVAADAKTKARMRADADAAMKSAMRNTDFETATAWLAVTESFKAAVAANRETVTDYTATVSDLAATLELAAATLRTIGATVGDVTYRATMPGTPDADAAAKLAVVRTRKSGRHGAVVDWINAHATDVPQKVAALRATHVPSADYPDGPPSAGAIGAAMDRVAAKGLDVDFAEARIDGDRAIVAV